MAVVITIAQQKGGAGKTTLAASLAAAYAATHRVAVLDIDPQGSLARWHALRTARTKPAPDITLSDISGWRLAAELDKLRRSFDILIVDSPPSVETDARLAIRAADLVLVPMQPSPPDLWAAAATLKLALTEKRQVRVILNRTPSSSKLRTTIETELATQTIPTLTTTLGNRTTFATAFAQGLGATESSPRSTAAAELLALVGEIEGLRGSK